MRATLKGRGSKFFLLHIRVTPILETIIVIFKNSLYGKEAKFVVLIGV